jgi:hypothetical protein
MARQQAWEKTGTDTPKAVSRSADFALDANPSPKALDPTRRKPSSAARTVNKPL